MKSNKHALPGTGFLTSLITFFIIKPVLFIIFIFHGLTYLPHRKKLPKGPIFLLGNHHSNWDGLYAVIYYFFHIPHFIVHDGLFQFPWLRWVINNGFGQINRGRFNHRITAARTIIQYAKQRHTVGLFPEGDIHMLGGSLPFDLSAAKLVKYAHLPLVIFQVKGAYQRAPRWSDRAFKTKITIETVEVLSQATIAALSLQELHDLISKFIHVDAYENPSMTVQSNRRAERLERALFWCPQCQHLFTLTSNNNTLSCRDCAWEVHVNRSLTYSYSFKHDGQFPVHPKQHDDWQKTWVQKNMDVLKGIKSQTRLSTTHVTHLHQQHYTNVSMSVSSSSFIVKNVKFTITIPMRDIQSYRLIHRTSLAFIYHDQEYLFHIDASSPPGYFWVLIIDLFQRILYNNKEVLS
jgi:1-acyl-sn-glycerol-3-phosphate acyltransferase